MLENQMSDTVGHLWTELPMQWNIQDEDGFQVMDLHPSYSQVTAVIPVCFSMPLPLCSKQDIIEFSKTRLKP